MFATSCGVEHPYEGTLSTFTEPMVSNVLLLVTFVHGAGFFSTVPVEGGVEYQPLRVGNLIVYISYIVMCIHDGLHCYITFSSSSFSSGSYWLMFTPPTWRLG